MLPGDEIGHVITPPICSSYNNSTIASTSSSVWAWQENNKFEASTTFSSVWTWQENKIFEVGLVNHPDGTPNRWAIIASEIPGKSVEEVIKHYEELMQDLAAMDARPVELPVHDNEDDDDDDVNGVEKFHNFGEPSSSNLMNCSNSSSSEAKDEIKKQRANPWSEEEHKLFLKGLAEYGRGDWRSISRFAVKTRTPSQVASHAQKYFLHKKNRVSPLLTSLVDEQLRARDHDTSIYSRVLAKAS